MPRRSGGPRSLGLDPLEWMKDLDEGVEAPEVETPPPAAGSSATVKADADDPAVPANVLADPVAPAAPVAKARAEEPPAPKPEPESKPASPEETEGEDAGRQMVVNGEQYLGFYLGERTYAVEILRVRELRAWGGATRVPQVPGYVCGVINVRGTITPVIDLRERLGMATRAYDQETTVILVQVLSDGKERVMGLVADSLADVYELQAEEIQSPPEYGVTIDVDYIKGLAEGGNAGTLLILDVDRLLDDTALRGTLSNPSLRGTE